MFSFKNKKNLFAGLIIATYILALFISIYLNNPDPDSGFLFAMGKYIFLHMQVPRTMFWSVTGNNPTIIQQPLCALLNYIFGSIKEPFSYYILAFLQFVFFYCCIYRLSKTILDKNKSYNLLITTLLSVFGFFFATTRPYLVSFGLSFLTLDIFLTMNFKRLNEPNNKHILYLFLIGLFQSNFQAAGLLYHLIWMFTGYLCAFTFIFLHKKHDILQIYVRNVLLSTSSFFLGSYINSNGINAYLYLYKARHAVKVFEIEELSVPGLFSIQNGFLILFICLSIYLYKNKDKYFFKDDIEIYYYFGFTIISTIFAILALRNLLSLIIPCMFAISLLPKDKMMEKFQNGLKNPPITFVLEISAAFLLCLYMIYSFSGKDLTNPYMDKKVLSYLEPGDIIYTDFNTGAFLEKEGYKIYIDARPELYAEDICGKDIINEAKNIHYLTIDPEEFRQKYGFTKFLTTKGTYERYLRYSSSYNLLYENNNICLYEYIG